MSTLELKDKQFDFISKEIEFSYSQLDKQRETTTTYLKIYISLLVALFAYISYIQTKLTFETIKINLPEGNLIMFGFFGIIGCSLVFLIGWALLDNVTRAVFKSIKYYKHISYLRDIVSNTFPDEIFKNNSVLPLREETITIRISQHVPTIGAILNFLLLGLIYYFLNLFLNSVISYLITISLITIISIFYSNLLEKHFEEVAVAQQLAPNRDEALIKTVMRRLVLIQKKKENYVKTRSIYFLVLGLLFISVLLFVIFFIKNKAIIHTFWISIPTVLFVISTIPRRFMGVHRLKNLKCF